MHMARFLTDSNPSRAVRIAFNLPNDELCLEGYEPLGDGEVRVGDGLRNAAKRALRAPPANWPSIPSKAGIYMFEIAAPGGAGPEVYVGKASSLKSRLADYIEMTRRLLGLYHSFPMWTDGNGFRYVHYRMAAAIVDQRDVALWYLEAPHVKSGQDLARLELLEIAFTTMGFHIAGNPGADSRLLNAYDGLKSSSHGNLPTAWAAVRSLLQ